ncbi:NAD/NADP dependent alcohol dehydrogenase [Chamberlinius hualienensis]
MDSTDGKVITCKAAIVYELNSPIKVEQITVLPPTPGHVRVKMVASALCHSDLAVLSGYKTNVKRPYIPGHEGGGIVESVGEGVTSVKKGDKVLTLFFPHCGECQLCLSKKTNMCLDIKRKIPVTSPFMRNEGLDGLVSYYTLNGEKIYHCYSASSFSEYAVIPENSCVKVHRETNLNSGCILACGFLTGYGASANAVNIKPNDKVAIWGLGGVGLACVVGCQHKKAATIIGIDVAEDKEAVAKKFGCTDFIASSNLENGQTIKDKIMQLTKYGIDFAFVCVGKSEILKDAIQCLAQGGTAVIVGVTQESETFSLPLRFLLQNKRIQGTIYGDYSIFEDVPKMAERYVNGELPLDEFITNTCPLDNINDSFNLMRQGKSIRSIVKF